MAEEYGRSRIKKLKYTTLPEITSKVFEAREKNTPEETISRFLSQRGYTTQSFTKAVNNQTAKDEARPAEEQEQGGGFWDTVTDGLEYFNKATDSLMTGRTFGLAVPARAAGRWAAKNMPWRDEEEAETISESMGAIQAEDTQWREENPNVAMGTEIVGAIGGGMGAAKTVTTAVPALAPVAAQTTKNIIKGAGTFGGIGLVEGAGIAAAKDENVILGGAAGLVGGVAGEFLMPIAKWLIKRIATPIKKLAGKPVKKDLTKAEIKGEQMLEEVDIKDGITLEAKRAKLDEYERLKLGPEVMEIDLLGKKGQNLAGTIMRYGDKVPDAAETALVKRAGGVRQHLYNFLQDATGGSRVSLKKTVKELRDKAKLDSSGDYDSAFYVDATSSKSIFRTVSDKRLNDLFKMPEFNKAYRRAIYLAKHDIPPVKLDPIPKGGFKEGHEFPVYALDKVKKALSSKFGRNSIFHPDSNVQALAAGMTGHKNAMLDIIGETIPDYKRARDFYAGSMELKDATELGQKLFDSGDSMDKLYEFSTKLKTESEKKAFRNAAFNVLAKKIEASSANPKGMAQYFLNEQNLHKLSLIIPDPEARGIFMRQNELLSGFVDVKNKILAGTQTVEKLAADAAEEEMNQGLRAAANIANRNPAGLMLQAQDIGGGARRAARLDVAGKKVYGQGTPQIFGDQWGTKFTNEALKKGMRGQSLLQGAGAGAGASLLSSQVQ